ncbi:efflux RND transporter periplasmic adaptor subunit [Micromonospora sp. WMMD998]|uniref:efflux RND transporter periplasmic adaptor subunit n=1 Tax=Micromonospora sp. WMMD998 TaxID=3016092 RepID=UPI00249B6594|nr:efflux RND transporter periplasmic adaptor subunit [Micromonospora sp. WMMD998]WFE37372.1 efflux RND transporter periplasmic adaptor subunit [Micromonospora sp. WMMD998]
MRVRLPALLHRPPVAVNAALALLLLGGGYWAWSSVTGDSAAQVEPGRSARSVVVSRGTVTATVTADGSIESATTASAGFVTAGTVTDIRVRVGQTVKKGQLLATVDPAAAERALKLARANLDAAENALDRARAADGDTSSAENAVTQAELAVDEAEAGVAGTRLAAPMAGTVVAVNGTVGSSSGGGSTGNPGGGSPGGSGGQQDAGTSSTATGFVDLADLTHLQVSAAVAEADATRLKSGQTATVTWNALSGARAAGKVTAIDPQATTSNNVVTYGVTIGLGELPVGAKPGQTVTVSVVTGTAQDVLLVNSTAVSGSGDRHTVTVVTETGEETRRVQVGLAGNQAYEITSGLAEGERVVLPESSAGTGNTGGGPRGGANLPGGGFPGGGFPGGGQGPRQAGNAGR